MPITVTETHDLSLYDRFDANTDSLRARLGTNGINITDQANEIPLGKKFAAYLSKNGQVLLLKEDPAGYEVTGGGRGGGKLLPCKPVIEAIRDRVEVYGNTKLEMRYSRAEALYIIKIPKKTTLNDHPAAVSGRGRARKEPQP